LPDLHELLAGAPADERSLLELGTTWRGLPEAHARVAARLRVFVLNWDPLGWLGDPFEASATATGDGDTFELVLYVPLADAETLLADLCRSVLDVAASQEPVLISGAYAQLAFAGKVPDLLSATGALSAIEPPEFKPAGEGWEPIGLGAIQDLVQARFGPVDLDRSTVALDAVAQPERGCPACAGERFGFPAELADAQAEMCPPHARRAAEITADRLARAEASNREGWRAIVDASSAVGEPTYGLPLDLLGRLEEAVNRVDPTLDELRVDATAALDLVDQVRGTDADFESWAEDWPSRDWMLELPWMLFRRGLVDDAVRVADAFAELDLDHRSVFASDAAVMLANAGRADEARARADANVRAYPDDIWTRVHAGDVHRALGDADRAEQEFRRATLLVAAHGHDEDASIVNKRLAELLAAVPGRESDAAEAATLAKRSLGAALGQRIATKVGRNDPCPCGSGRKYKKCCGA
jgi:tetratricopeptide (TPR) repeat protein